MESIYKYMPTVGEMTKSIYKHMPTLYYSRGDDGVDNEAGARLYMD